MSENETVPVYFYDDIATRCLSPDKFEVIEIDAQNGPHFKLACATYQSLWEMRERLSELLERDFKYFKFLCGDIIINPKKEIGKYSTTTYDPIQIKASLYPFDYDDSVYDTRYFGLFVLHHNQTFTAAVREHKTIEEYWQLLQAKMGLKPLENYDIYDYKGKKISAKRPLNSIPIVDGWASIKIKEKPTFESVLPKLAKLLDWCKAKDDE